MNKCSRIEEMIKNENTEIDFIADTVDSELSGHLAGCSDCESLIADIKSVSDKIRSLSKVSVSADFNERLWSKIRQIEQVNAESSEKEADRSIPFFSRAVYYVSGIAAIVIAFIYVSSLGILDLNNSNSIQPGTSGMSVASEYDQSDDKTVTDSLESLGKNVTEDEELRLKVSTGE